MASDKTGVPVSFDKVQKSFGAVRVLEELNLQIEPGEFLVLLGASGSGKTTALRILSGLETATAGRVLIGDRDVTDILPKYRDISMVFQSYALYPHKTVAENIGFPLKVRKVPQAEQDVQIREAAAQVQLGELLDRYPRQLSGGQRQRVALARAIIRRPSVFLMDEPLSNLDAKLRGHMRAELKHMQQKLGITTIYVTHDQIEAMTLAHRVAILERGMLQQLATPAEIYNNPANLFVAQFIGSPPMNVMQGALEGKEFPANGANRKSRHRQDCQGRTGRQAGGLHRRRAGQGRHQGRNLRDRADRRPYPRDLEGGKRSCSPSRRPRISPPSLVKRQAWPSEPSACLSSKKAMGCGFADRPSQQK